MIDGSFDGDRTVAAVRDSRYVCDTTEHGGVRVCITSYAAIGARYNYLPGTFRETPVK